MSEEQPTETDRSHGRWYSARPGGESREHLGRLLTTRRESSYTDSWGEWSPPPASRAAAEAALANRPVAEPRILPVRFFDEAPGRGYGRC